MVVAQIHIANVRIANATHAFVSPANHVRADVTVTKDNYPKILQSKKSGALWTAPLQTFT